jgi:hypothetical protein
VFKIVYWCLYQSKEILPCWASINISRGYFILKNTWSRQHALTSCCRGFWDCLKHTFSSQHATLHGCVSSLNLGDIKEASAATYNASTRECELGYGLQSSLIQCSSAICNSKTQNLCLAFIFLIIYKIYWGYGVKYSINLTALV